MTETVTPLSETVSQIVRSRTCGCRDFYIAKITQNDATGYVAGTPVKLARAIKAKVEIVQEKSNEVMEKAIDAMGRLADRPIDMRLNDDTLIASTSDRYQDYQQTQITRTNRIWGRPLQK